ncbi:MAG TPA: nucleotidyltransferase domain-containing protein [Candidatus Bathyarchaeia archaeon]|nr:nucleotidyltransferase domain-containing protein [Candidatus Bathyarchaeia archaeon]
MASSEAILRKKRSIARTVLGELKKSFGANLLAVGLIGSVARGTAEKFSDVDLLIILQRLKTTAYTYKIVDDTHCSLNFETWKTAISKLREPHPELPETLGGFTKILGVYDPDELLPRLEDQARRIPSNVFRKSAELAMIYSFEDFCRAKNAFLKKDDIVLKDNISNVTHSAANAVAALNETGFVSDREIFKAYKKFGKLHKNFATIRTLRYGNPPRPELFRTLIRFYVGLVDFCKQEGVDFPVEREVLENLA